jgi:hypothetical protein
MNSIHLAMLTWHVVKGKAVPVTHRGGPQVVRRQPYALATIYPQGKNSISMELKFGLQYYQSILQANSCATTDNQNLSFMKFIAHLK